MKKYEKIIETYALAVPGQDPAHPKMWVSSRLVACEARSKVLVLEIRHLAWLNYSPMLVKNAYGTIW